MQLIQTSDDINTIASNNPSKKIGKFTINCNKINNGELTFTEGHQLCINVLRDSTCEIVILEFLNSYNLYSDSTSIQVPQIIDETSVLNICISENLDVEYVLYNSSDVEDGFDQADIDLVDSRLTTEDYKNVLNIPDDTYYLLRKNLEWLTSREPLSNMIVTRSYKIGTESLAINHYINKYMNCEFAPIAPKFFTGTSVPISASIDVEELHQETKDFFAYFDQVEKSAIISDSTAVQADLEQYADGLGCSTEDFFIIDDVEFVGSGNIFMSIKFTGPYNSTVTANKWL